MKKTILAIAIGAAALATGCGGKTIDAGDLEDQLATQLSADAGVEAADVSLDCPEDQSVEEGSEFDCTLTAPNGDEVTVKSRFLVYRNRVETETDFLVGKREDVLRRVDGGWKMGSDVPLFDGVSQAAVERVQVRGQTRVLPKNPSMGSMSSGGLY